VDSDSNRNQSDREQVQRRQAVKIVMAIVLIWIALTSSSKAVSPDSIEAPYGTPCGVPDGSTVGCQLQFDGFTPLPVEAAIVTTDPAFKAVYAQLYAELANLDADAAPDGWRASVVVRTRNDLPLSVPVRASFEIEPRGLQQRRYGIDQRSIRDSARQFIPKMRWTRQLVFDDQGVATVTLEARESIRQLFDWDRIGDVGLPDRVSQSYRRFSGEQIDRLRGSRYHRHFVTQDLFDRIDYPATSWLRVRVSIPGQQTLEAVTPVDLRPQVLVDTPYRYR
jgi:hypothetical protein